MGGCCNGGGGGGDIINQLHEVIMSDILTIPLFVFMILSKIIATRRNVLL
jgi:hypothetical protein